MYRQLVGCCSCLAAAALECMITFAVFRVLLIIIVILANSMLTYTQETRLEKGVMQLIRIAIYALKHAKGLLLCYTNLMSCSSEEFDSYPRGNSTVFMLNFNMTCVTIWLSWP